jgi:carboxypeptidase family protein
MRHFRPVKDSVRRSVFAGIGTSLAIGLMAALMPAGQAAPAVPAKPATLAGAASAKPSRKALERAAIAAAAADRGAPSSGYARILAAINGDRPQPGTSGSLSTVNGAASTAPSGLLTGIVHIASKQASPICVLATGTGTSTKTARVQRNGRYVLSVRPGRYTMHVGRCTDQLGSQAGFTGALWADQSRSVSVQAGQLETLPAAIWWQVTSSSVSAPSGAAAAPATARTGSLSGLVTGHGRPLAKICAVAVNGNGSGHLTETTKNGTYQLRNLRPGRYQVLFATGPRRCPTVGNWLPQWYPGVTSFRQFRKIKRVRVEAGKDTTGINAKLKLGAEISGTVLNTSAKGIAGICAIPQSSSTDGLSTTNLNSSGSSGRYELRALVPGKYRVLFETGCGSKANYGYQWWKNSTSEPTAGVIKLTGGQIRKGVNATLLPGATVAGTVVAESTSGQPIAGVCVSVFGSDGRLYNGNSLPTTKTGTFRLRGLAAGVDRIAFDPTCTQNGRSKYLFAQHLLTLAVGQQDLGLKVVLKLGGGISGLVTDARGRPVSGACVRVLDDNGDSTVTSASGSYRLVGIATGRYLVEIGGGCGNSGSLAPQFYPDQAYTQSAQLVRFRPDTVTLGIDARLQPGATITGKVTDTSGRPVARACALALGTGVVNGGNLTGSFRQARVRNGRYEIANLAPGTYELAFGCGHYGTQIYRSETSLASATSLAASAGQLTRVGVRLSRAATIAGRVTDAAGKPLTGVCAAASPVGSGSEYESPFSFTGRTGRYRITGLQPGRYQVQFASCGVSVARTAQQWYPGQLTIAKAGIVAVRQGQTATGINAALVEGGSISGVVTGSSHRPAGNLCVEATDLAEGSAAFVVSGKLGGYTLRGLSAGRYTVTAEPCLSNDGLAGEQRDGLVTVAAGQAKRHINLQLPAGGSVSGQLLGGDAGTTPESNVCVLVVPVNPNGSASIGYTGVHGNYLINDLKPGKYRADVADPDCDAFPDAADPFAPEWFPNQPGPATATTFAVKADKTTTDISDVLHPFGSITGSVSTSKGAVAGECVIAVPAGSGPDPLDGVRASQEIAITDHAGNYALLELPPGRYRIEFSTGCGAKAHPTRWWHNAKSAMAATVITVKFATITAINATLTR